MLTFTKKKTGSKELPEERKLSRDNSSLASSDQSDLWLKKHSPTAVNELAMHHARVKSCSMLFWAIKLLSSFGAPLCTLHAYGIRKVFEVG